MHWRKLSRVLSQLALKVAETILFSNVLTALLARKNWLINNFIIVLGTVTDLKK